LVLIFKILVYIMIVEHQSSPTKTEKERGF
jgi:hypothetical protein